MTNACNSALAPGKEYSDDLQKSQLEVGTQYSYCVSAVAAAYMAQSNGNNIFQPFLKSSDSACAVHSILWVSNQF